MCRYNTEQYSPYAAPSPQGSYQPSPSPQSYHQVAPSPVGYQNTHSPASYHPTPSPMAYQVDNDAELLGLSLNICVLGFFVYFLRFLLLIRVWMKGGELQASGLVSYRF